MHIARINIHHGLSLVDFITYCNTRERSVLLQLPGAGLVHPFEVLML